MARKIGSDSAVTKNDILRESLVLFAEQGFAAVSMRQIADRVGIQPSAIYQYHTNKQQLLVAVLSTHMDSLLEALRAEQQDEPPLKALVRFIRLHIRFHLTRPDEVFVSYMELRSLEPENYRRIEAQRSAYEGALKKILAEGAQDGSLQVSDHHVSAMAILSMLAGVNTWFRSGGRLSEHAVEAIYVEMVLGAVGAPLSAAKLVEETDV